MVPLWYTWVPQKVPQGRKNVPHKFCGNGPIALWYKKLTNFLWYLCRTPVVRWSTTEITTGMKKYTTSSVVTVQLPCGNPVVQENLQMSCGTCVVFVWYPWGTLEYQRNYHRDKNIPHTFCGKWSYHHLVILWYFCCTCVVNFVERLSTIGITSVLNTYHTCSVVTASPITVW